jgi:hypothetical protein
MRRLTAAGAVAAAALGTMAPALPSAGAAPAPEPTSGQSPAKHCVVQAATGRDSRTQTTLGCFDSFAEAQDAASVLGAAQPLGAIQSLAAPASQGAAVAMASGLVTLGWHFEHHYAGGSSITIMGSSCSATWYPSPEWRSSMSSTRPGNACSGAKHYTLSSCGGSYQVTGAGYPTVTNLVGALNDNVGCVKYQ